MRIGKPHPDTDRIRTANANPARGRGLLAAALVLLLVTAIGLGLGGCESKPDAPTFDNVFDPDGPWDGDPLRIYCDFGDSSIVVKWNQPQGQGISYYAVSHSTSPTTGFEYLEDVAATSKAEGQYIYQHAKPTAPHWFRVVAFNDDEEFLATSLQTPGDGSTGPYVALSTGLASTPTRFLRLTIGASQGDSVRIANRADFADAQAWAFDEDLSLLEVDWVLDPADANGETLNLYARVWGDGYVSPVTEKELKTQFDPKLVLDGGGTTCATRTPLLAASTAGPVQVRLGTSAAEVEAAEWVDYLPANLVWEIEDTLEAITVHAQFRGDFGYDSTVKSLTFSGDPLTDVDVDIDLNGITNDPIVRLFCDAVATEVRVGELDSFATAAWQAYADTIETTLSAGSGHKIIYVQYRNDFTDSAVLSVAADYIALSPTVGFRVPSQSQHLLGGMPLEVSGWANSLIEEAALDSVRVHFPDGNGWIAPVGVRDWTATWNVPAVASSVDLVLRARAWAGGESATAEIMVTVDPLPSGPADQPAGGSG